MAGGATIVTPTGKLEAMVDVALTGDLPVAITKPVKGGTPETAITGTNYIGSITWTPTDTGGKFAANTEYTAKDGYQFASDVTPTVAGSDSVTGVTVKDSGSKLEFKATFPKTGSATLKGIDIITNPALELAVPTAAPNATATNERSLAVTGVYDDGSGGPVAVNWEITTDPIPKGVSLVGSTLKVTNEAEAGTFTIKATSTEGSYTDIETVTITKDAPTASAIVATAPATGTNITVPNGGTNTSGQCSYKVYDQYGAAMTGIGATWKMKLEPATVTGVTLIPANGSISVTSDATTCKATLHAESGALKSNEITFNIIREESKPSVVTITGKDSMNVPIVHAPGADGWNHEDYTAEVKDQYNNVISNPSVEWSVTDATGVSIDNTTGKLTVTNKANAGTVTITAKSGDASGTKNVTINKPEAKATLVEICDQVGEAPETNLPIPTGSGTNNVDYTAKVYDQYGKETAGMVYWELDKSYTGVELDTTTSTGNAILKVENTTTPGTIKLIATCSTVDSTASQTLDIALTNKTPATVTTPPTAKTGLEYNGDEQALVTAGIASGGTMQYSLGASPWSTTIPTAKDAATYTVQYRVAGDSAHADSAPGTLEVTIAPKTLTKDDLTPTGSTSKVYDGMTNSSITVGVKAGVLFGSDTLAITGTAVYNSADVNEANTITFTPDAITTGNYTLAATEKLTITDAKITPRDLIVTPNSGQSKKFGTEDPTLHSTTSGKVSGQIPDYTGALSRAEGKNVGQYDITLGTLALMDHFSSGFKASNYTLKMVSPAVKFEITKADAPMLTNITVSQKYTVTTEQSKDIGRAGMPEGAGALTYAKGAESKTTGSVTIDRWDVDATGKVTYTLSGGAAGDTVTLPVIIGSVNYADSTVNVVITLTKPSSSGGGGGTSSYAITVDSAKNGDVTASHKTASKGTTVTLTVDPDKGYVLDTLTVLDGKDKEIKLTEKNGKYTFTMPASKVTVEAMFKAEQSTGNNPFIDVPAGSYYEDAVIWAVDKGITTGTDATHFSPDGICTRAQAVTFLWRAAGSPAAKSSAMPFVDVKAGSYYETAVLWAVENGITKGTSDTMFSPDATCTRAQIVTFLWRANGSPAVSGDSAFTDVASDAYYAAAVTWAEKNDVTGGIGGGLFGSGNDCTRAQIVTFLYRSVK
ncbi:S-layer homology domain-containing protein [Agathobaculum hominis]